MHSKFLSVVIIINNLYFLAISNGNKVCIQLFLVVVTRVVKVNLPNRIMETFIKYLSIATKICFLAISNGWNSSRKRREKNLGNSNAISIMQIWMITLLNGQRLQSVLMLCQMSMPRNSGLEIVNTNTRRMFNKISDKKRRRNCCCWADDCYENDAANCTNKALKKFWFWHWQLKELFTMERFRAQS